MRILQLVDSLAIGGGERMAVNIANYFHSEGVSHLLVVSRDTGPLSELIVAQNELKFLKKKSFFDLRSFLSLLKLVSSFKPTHIHAHDSSIYWASGIKLFFPKLKIIWHAHYGGLIGDDKRFGKNIPRIARFIDLMVAVNEELVDWAKKELPIIKHAVFIPNFPFIPQLEKVKSSEDLIICIANLKPPKNHFLLVKAFSRFVEKFPSYELELIGSQEDTEYTQQLKELIITLGLTEKIKLIGPKIDLISFFQRAKFAVLSSEVEGLPVSLLELGLAEVPVISSEVGYCGELLGFGEFGYLFPSGNEDLLVESMLHLANHLPEAKDKVAKFSSRVKKEFGEEQFGKKYRNSIAELN